jgi:hypothetical protein
VKLGYIPVASAILVKEFDRFLRKEFRRVRRAEAAKKWFLLFLLGLKILKRD